MQQIDIKYGSYKKVMVHCIRFKQIREREGILCMKLRI
jgi:hypothetical protein